MTQLSDKTRVRLTIATVCSVIMFIVYTTYIVTKDRQNIVSRIDTLTALQTLNRSDIEQLKSENNNKAIKLAEINVKLANIETILAQVQQSLK
jgi:predicted PurR-regulated permease PerM